MVRSQTLDQMVVSSIPDWVAVKYSNKLQLWASCSYPCASVAKQYKLVTAKAGK